VGRNHEAVPRLKLAVVSALMAGQDAEISPARENRERVGAMMGSALAGVAYAEEQQGHFAGPAVAKRGLGLQFSGPTEGP
jgi:3-oxoacyl-(acyl-carrier-protein) synthase